MSTVKLAQPDEHSTHGHAESSIRMSDNGTRRLLAGCNLGERYWDYASSFYWFLQQRTRPASGAQCPARRDGQEHPRLPLHGVGAFGCLAAFRRIDRRKGTYEASSVLGINLGIDTASSFPCYNTTSTTWRQARSAGAALFASSTRRPSSRFQRRQGRNWRPSSSASSRSVRGRLTQVCTSLPPTGSPAR